MNTLRWGIMGTAKIAREWIIPAIQESRYAEFTAVASRDLNRALAIANAQTVKTPPPLAFGSYEELLASDKIDAVYIPLPNHLHVPWSIKALKAGKHVLCEKPLGLNSKDLLQLQEVSNSFPDLLIMEAFMYRFHPQWLRVKDLVESGELGQINQVQACFTYNNKDSANIRNMPGIGGGGLMDIGCYCISAARLIFGKEPLRVVGNLDWDPDFGTDRHASGILDFGQGMATFQCSTQSHSSQSVNIVGDRGALQVENPFFRRNEIPSRLIVYREGNEETITIGHFNHYVCQVDAFCLAALNQLAVPTPLNDALNNMKVIDAVFASAHDKTWVSLER